MLYIWYLFHPQTISSLSNWQTFLDLALTANLLTSCFYYWFCHIMCWILTTLLSEMLYCHTPVNFVCCITATLWYLSQCCCFLSGCVFPRPKHLHHPCPISQYVPCSAGKPLISKRKLVCKKRGCHGYNFFQSCSQPLPN